MLIYDTIKCKKSQEEILLFFIKRFIITVGKMKFTDFQGKYALDK